MHLKTKRELPTGIFLLMCALSILVVSRVLSRRHCLFAWNDTICGELVKESIVPFPTPWSCIGGCGASSGGGVNDRQLKWIGKGVSGTLLDCEVQGLYSLLADTALDPSEQFDGRMRLQSNSLVLTLGYHPQWFDTRLFIPLVARRGFGTQSGGFGDVAVEVARSWGMTGGFRTSFTTTFPTGKYNVPLTAERLLVPEMQPGTGTLAGTILLEYGFDFDWGLLNLGLSGKAGLLTIQTTDYGYDKILGRVISVEKSIEIARQDFAVKNDVGTLYPDIVSIHADAGIRQSGKMHGFSATLSFPLYGAAYHEREVSYDNSFSNDPTDTDYFRDKASAQHFADTVTNGNDTLKYENPVVVGLDGRGRWVVMEQTRIARKSYPGLSLQYSVEKSDISLPLLFGCSVHTEIDRGVRFTGITAGIGIKFRIY